MNNSEMVGIFASEKQRDAFLFWVSRGYTVCARAGAITRDVYALISVDEMPKSLAWIAIFTP